MCSISKFSPWLLMFQLAAVLALGGASQPQNRAKARIEEKLSMPCPLDIPRLLHLAWNRCTTEDQCRANWDKYRIARITDKTIVYVDYPERYELATNGTLTVKEVIPEDDNKLFICRGIIRYEENVENITVLEIIREPPKISTWNPLEYEVFEGMPLILEFKVHGYPYALVSLSHNHDILLNGTKVDPVFIRQNATQSYNGEYTCTAENPLGNTSVTITVKVTARAGINSTCQGNRTGGTNTTDHAITTTDNPKESSEPPPGTNTTDHAITTTDNPKESSEPPPDNLNTEGGCNCVVWQALFWVLLVISGVAVGVLLKLYLNLKRYHHNTSQIGSGDFELVIGHNNQERCARSEDGIEGGSQVEGTNGVGGDHEDMPLEL